MIEFYNSRRHELTAESSTLPDTLTLNYVFKCVSEHIRGGT